MNPKNLQTIYIRRERYKQTAKHLMMEVLTRSAKLEPTLTERQRDIWQIHQDFDFLLKVFTAYGAFVRGYMWSRRSKSPVILRSQVMGRVRQYMDNVRDESRKELSRKK